MDNYEELLRLSLFKDFKNLCYIEYESRALNMNYFKAIVEQGSEDLQVGIHNSYLLYYSKVINLAYGKFYMKENSEWVCYSFRYFRIKIDQCKITS